MICNVRPRTKSTVKVTDNDLDSYFADAERRNISIVVHDYFGSPDPPQEMCFAVLPGDCYPRRDELIREFLRDLYGRDGYSINHRRSVIECGASGGSEEIAIEVTGGVATFFILEAIRKLRSWLSSAVNPEEASSDAMGDEECLDTLKLYLERFYRPSGTLTFLSHQGFDDRLEAQVRDSRGTVWTCSIDRITALTRLKRV